MRKIASSKTLAKVIIELFSLFFQYMNCPLQAKSGSVLTPNFIS